MGKFIKTCLIIGVICVVVGAATSGAGIFSGGLTQLKEEILNGKWTIKTGENTGVKPFFELEERHYFNENVDISVDKERVQDAYSSAKVQKLNIKSAGVSVTFTEYDGKDFLVEANMVHEYQAFLKDGELYVIARGQNVKELGNGNVTISIPTAVYDGGLLELDIESSASKVVFDRLVARDIELDVSAGTVSWQEMSVGELSVEMAAGTVSGINTTVTGGADMKVSAGTITLTGVLGTETEIETAAGKVEISLTDAYSDYNYDISCAGGSVTVGEQTVEGVAKTLEMEHGAMKHMDVECSVGAVNIRFAEE